MNSLVVTELKEKESKFLPIIIHNDDAITINKVIRKEKEFNEETKKEEMMVYYESDYYTSLEYIKFLINENTKLNEANILLQTANAELSISLIKEIGQLNEALAELSGLLSMLLAPLVPPPKI